MCDTFNITGSGAQKSILGKHWQNVCLFGEKCSEQRYERQRGWRGEDERSLMSSGKPIQGVSPKYKTNTITHTTSFQNTIKPTT